MSIQWSKNSLFNKWCWENWTSTCKNKIRPPTHTILTRKSKQIKELNIGQGTIKILAEKQAVKFYVSYLAIFLLLYLLKQEKKGKNNWAKSS